MPRYHRRCCAAIALSNALPLPPKLRFCQAAASATKLAAAAVLPPPLPLPSSCHRCATTAYKIKEKYVIILINLVFTTMVMAASSNNGGPTRQRQ
jgi:hypothetical protein